MIQYTIRLYDHHAARNKGTILAIFGTFSRRSAEINLKTDDKTSTLFSVACNISTLHTWNNFV